MKEIPILFSTLMVQAILAGRKTMTRRTSGLKDMNDNPDNFHYIGNSSHIDIPRLAKKYDTDIYHQFGLIRNNEPAWVITCPYGKPGDILWVKEEHYAWGWWAKEGLTKTGKQKWKFIDFTFDHDGKYHYSDCPPEDIITGRPEMRIGWYKRNSLFMPKEAARIWLKGKSTWAERLQDITEEDAIAEGVYCYGYDDPGCNDYKNYLYDDKDGDDWGLVTAKQSFQSLWESINGPESWQANPWVWVVGYEVLSTTGRPELLK